MMVYYFHTTSTTGRSSSSSSSFGLATHTTAPNAIVTLGIGKAFEAQIEIGTDGTADAGDLG
jgi:hypothetical protein